MFDECLCVSGEGFLLGRRLVLQECGSIFLHAQVDMADDSLDSTAGGCACWKGHWHDDYS